MLQIDIDFEVFKQLTNRRPTEAVTYNDVIRELLKLTTPSAAAIRITGSNVNGWRFWKCRLPGAPQFVPIERLRGKAH